MKVLLVLLVFFMGGCGYISKDIHDNQTKIAQLEQQVAEAQAQLDRQNYALSQHDAQIAALRASRDSILALIASLQTSNALTDSEIADLQVTVQNLTVQIAVLEGYSNIATIIDPCGDAAGKVDEIILQLSNGQLLASFSDNSNGKNTRFSLLGDGSYATTDGSSCNFTVVNGVVNW